MSWAEYVEKVAGTSVQSEIARELGVSQSTVGRWFAGSTPSAEMVLAFARHYDRDLTEALLAGAGEDYGQVKPRKTVTRVKRGTPRSKH